MIKKQLLLQIGFANHVICVDQHRRSKRSKLIKFSVNFRSNCS